MNINKEIKNKLKEINIIIEEIYTILSNQEFNEKREKIYTNIENYEHSDKENQKKEFRKLGDTGFWEDFYKNI